MSDVTVGQALPVQLCDPLFQGARVVIGDRSGPALKLGEVVEIRWRQAVQGVVVDGRGRLIAVGEQEGQRFSYVAVQFLQRVGGYSSGGTIYMSQP